MLERKAQYDNSILYTDFIIDEIIKRFEAEDSVVIYLSDHAEEVCDDPNNCIFLHPKTNKYTVEIPFIIWMSQSLRKKQPDLEKQISENCNKPYMTDDMIHTL